MAGPLHFQTRIYFFLLCLLSPFLYSTPLSTAKQQCLSDQKSVLLQMKHDILSNSSNFDEFTTIKEWNSEKDCCSWKHVTCDSAGHVIGLNLSHQHLSGNSSAILRHSIPQLHFLSMLRLDGSDLSSMSLNFLSNLSNLESLSLLYCGLHGNFPVSVFLLPKIRNIILAENIFLTGQLPEFSSNSSLESLELSSTSFYGRIPNSIINLKYLKYLSLRYCNFFGMIPYLLSNLSHISDLDLASNKFTGSIPPFHSHGVPKLVYLDLSSNQFSGVIHSSLFTLPLLHELLLFENEFLGQLEQFPNASSSVLRVLNLGVNNLRGPIPRGILELPQLTSLWLYWNHFEGSMKLEMFQNLKSLSSLSLSNSGLSFRYDNSSCQLPHLEYLEMSNCDLIEFPNILNNQVPLLFLDLSNNHIRGHVLNWIWKSTLEDLLLSNNEIDFQEPLLLESNANMPHFLVSGNNSIPMLHSLECQSCNITNFPDFLKFQKKMQYLDLSNNNIDGKAPSWLWGMQSLQALNISHNDLDGFDQTLPNVSSTSLLLLDVYANKLQGSFPITICNLSTLLFLDASQNHLSGLIPECIGKIDTLHVLNLNWNYFQCMPPNFTLMTKLHSLKLNGNQLEGELPRSLVNCINLVVLDLGNNKIHDTFPFWLEKLSVLKVLVLRGNNFYGPIDDHSRRIILPDLRIMDLSSNKFTGELSKEFFQGLKAMVKINETKSQATYIGEENVIIYNYRDSVEIIEKGVNKELTRIITILTSLDLSNNEFVGKIPKEIGCLESLVVLNLSGNGFSNKIPSSLGNLAELESLDLSRNMLTGEIPLEFLRLTFLSVMNLSYNHLEGLIPQGKQLNTFSNDSYIGNANLCGAPLSKKCREDDAEMLPRKQSKNLEEETIHDWQIILMGYGCGVVVGFSIGFMLWPKMESLSLMMKFRETVRRKNQKRKSKHGHNLQERSC